MGFREFRGFWGLGMAENQMETKICNMKWKSMILVSFIWLAWLLLAAPSLSLALLLVFSLLRILITTILYVWTAIVRLWGFRVSGSRL